MSSASHTSRRMVLETCPVCAGPSWSLLTGAAIDGFEWARCPCGVVFKHAEPERVTGCHEPDAGHYDEAYFDRYARRRRRRVAKSRRQILDALEVAPPGRLLDVGCSLGYALEAARSLGIDAAGVDGAPFAVEHCRRLGFVARQGSLEDLPFEDASFSVVVLKHVFEHTATPRRALAELRRVLVPSGAVFLAVPDLEYFKAARRPGTSRFFRGEAARAHFVYYTPATLSRLLVDEGFRVAGVHPCLLHRRAGPGRRLAEAAAAPLRIPLRAAADLLGLRKEFWTVAVRTPVAASRTGG